jgi:hypothetical protein
MKNKTTQGLGNKNLLSFPKHDLLKYWRLVKVTPVKSLPLTHAKQPNMRVPTHMQCMKQNILINGSMEHAHLM